MCLFCISHVFPSPQYFPYALVTQLLAFPRIDSAVLYTSYTVPGQKIYVDIYV